MGFLSPIHPRVLGFPIALSLVGIAFVLAGWLLARHSRNGKEGAERWQS